ncbi:MAG: riboflavin synthase, partial [Polyangiaceae bacterium]
SSIHLERALRASDRLGGHMMTGHVDGVATLIERRPVGESLVLAFRVPESLAILVAEKGSVALDGVSLTVNAARGDRIEVAIIPHTQQLTTLGALSPGEGVNLEVDVLARYVARLLAVHGKERG